MDVPREDRRERGVVDRLPLNEPALGSRALDPRAEGLGD